MRVARRVCAAARRSRRASLWPQTRATTSALRHFTLPAIERLTTAVAPATPSDVYFDVRQPPRHHHSNDGEASGFAIQDSDRGVLDHGVSAEAKDAVAQAEDDYRASAALLHPAAVAAASSRLASGVAAGGGGGVTARETYVDATTGATMRVTRIAAPFGEAMVTSQNERFALRGHVGELAARQLELQPIEHEDGSNGGTRLLVGGGGLLPRYTIDERAQLALRKSRQLDELLAAPMPAAEAATAVRAVLRECYDHAVALLPRTAEHAMVLFSRVSLQLRLHGNGNNNSSNSSSNAEHAVIAVCDDTMADVPLLRDMRELYTHLKRTFCAPTPLMLEHLMLTLSAVPRASDAAFALANRLLLDADVYMVLPTRTTYAAYFAICHVNDAMPYALARFRDAVVRLCVPLDAAMTTALLRGFNELGYAEEALALLSRLRHVPLTTPLLNAMLETLLLSGQPLACFSALQAVQGAALPLDADTYTLLLLACEQSAQWHRVTYVLAEMQRRRVKGNARTLNLLLKGLLTQKLDAYALQLHATMRRKRVPVWPALTTGMQPLYARHRQRRSSSSKSNGYNNKSGSSNNVARHDDTMRPRRVTTATLTSTSGSSEDDGGKKRAQMTTATREERRSARRRAQRRRRRTRAPV